MELSESLDERKALRSELRDIRRRLFDAPSLGSTTAKQPVQTAVSKDTTASVEESNQKESAKISIGTDKMSSNRNRFQKLDDNNNNNNNVTTTTIKSTSKPTSASIRRSRASFGDPNSKSETKDDLVAKVETPTTTDKKVKVFAALNKPNEKFNSDDKNPVSKKSSVGNTAEEEAKSNEASGIRRTATWASKRQGSFSRKFETDKTNNSKFKFGAQVRLYL